MEKAFEQQYHELERTHWWFKGRRAYIRQLLKKEPKDAQILDIGCSSGILIEELIEDGFNAEHIYGIDISENAIANAEENGLERCYLMDAQNIELNRKFDLLIASDCLEHLEKDEQALKQWFDLLNEGGKLYVFVPAYMMLWSQHDVVNMHYRRYTRKELKQKLKAVGFELQKASYWNFFLFPLVLMTRMLQRLFKPKAKAEEGDLKAPSNFVNTIFLGLIQVENALLKGVSFPFGVSTFCVVKKNTSKR
jgi:2-polyprenyl-3-methyl-5-hydroxy-6-metoxy-1,4-benzoquinol methylase